MPDAWAIDVFLVAASICVILITIVLVGIIRNP